jgi:V8-like Glu-specific endopeptidase
VGHDSHQNQTYTGTAFFIGPTTLITAGHNAPTKDVKIMAQHPGTPNVSDPFKVLDGSVAPIFACKVLHTFFKNETDLTCDIAVLDCAGKYSIPVDKTLDIDVAEIHSGVSVDVVGYPGKYDEDFLQQEHGTEVDDIDEAYRIAKTILPRRELAITYGIVMSGGDNPVYRLSSISGMSGGPVILDGRVIGKTVLSWLIRLH